MFAAIVWQNPNVPAALWWVSLLNMALAAVAVGVNSAAARHGLRESARTHTLVAALAGLYFAGYVWLLFTDITVELWSNHLRTVAVLTWPIVWWLPAISSLRTGHRIRERASRVLTERGE